jgi:hypothetical protein
LIPVGANGKNDNATHLGADDAVVSSEWVRENVDKVKVIDASWALGKRAGQHAVKVPGNHHTAFFPWP